MIRPQSKERTNENNTDVDRWTDARRLRINGRPWRCPDLRDSIDAGGLAVQQSVPGWGYGQGAGVGQR
jgi:hypothetical protein